MSFVKLAPLVSREFRVSPSADVIIAGLGAMGSAAAYYLSRRGERVLALEARIIPREVAIELIRHGHDVLYVGEWANLMGCGELIVVQRPACG